MVLFVTLLAGCNNAKPNQTVAPIDTEAPGGTDQGANTDTEQAVKAKAEIVVTALRNSDVARIAALVHPDKGVRFSPYAHVDVEHDWVLTGNEVKDMFRATSQYVWGNYDGSGEPIELTFNDYIAKFVYDYDFSAAVDVKYNEFIGVSTTVNNLKEVYPEGEFVEYHYRGSGADIPGMDWKSLRLVFEQKGMEWYLVGVVHDQWTT